MTEALNKLRTKANTARAKIMQSEVSAMYNACIKSMETAAGIGMFGATICWNKTDTASYSFVEVKAKLVRVYGLDLRISSYFIPSNESESEFRISLRWGA